MNRLLAQGGFSSVAVQWVNCILLLALFVLAARHVDNQAARRSWLSLRIWMLVAVSVVLGWFYALPVLAPTLFGYVRGFEPLVLALYLFAKCSCWSSLWAGVHHLRGGVVSARSARILAVGLVAYSLIAMTLAPNLEGSLMFQAVIAVPVLAMALRGVASLQHLGTGLLRLVLLAMLVSWSVYLVVFLGPALGIYSIVETAYSIFWFSNSYVDTLLDSVLTFGLLLVLIEQTHFDAQATAQLRLARVRAQQSAMIRLSKAPDVAAGEFDLLVRRATEDAAHALDVDRVSVWMFGADRSTLVCQDLYHRSAATHSSGGILHVADLPQYFAALEEGRAIAANDAYIDERTAEFRESYLVETGVRSMLDAAIRASGAVAGVVCHEHVGAVRVWQDDEIAFAGVVADQLSKTLANQRTMEAERRRAEIERQLRHAQKLDAVGQLAGGVAHDFNNLLCAIMGYTSLAMEAASPELAAHLRHVDGAATRAAELTSKLLSFSRRQVLRKEVVELNSIVSAVLELVRRVTEESIEVSVSLSEGVGRVLADRSEIEQVILNLCNNARDAILDGGRLSVATRSISPQDRDEDPWFVEGRYAAIIVSDTGTGIAEADLDRIFEPFFTTKPEGCGTGLGLATSYGIVQQHGGAIRVRSEPGAGSEFRVWLPVVDLPVTETAAPENPPAPARDETILVVEDDGGVRGLIGSVLTHAGYHVEYAADGERAIQAFRDHHTEIDLVLLDSVLPRMSGPEVFAEIRSLSSTVPVVFASGYGTDGSLAVHGEVLPKPFTTNALLHAIRSGLDGPVS